MQLRSGKIYGYINFNNFIHYNKYTDIFIIKCLNYLENIDNVNNYSSSNYIKNIKKIEEIIKFYDYIFNNLSEIIENYDKVPIKHPKYNSLNKLFRQVLIITPNKLINDLTEFNILISLKDKMLKQDITDLLNVIIFRIKKLGYSFSTEE